MKKNPFLVCQNFSLSNVLFGREAKLIFQEGVEKLKTAVRTPEGPKEREKEKASLYQGFELGKHEVLSADKISKDYVNQISGSVDLTPYSDEKKSDEFYKTDVNAPCELLLSLYKGTSILFTPSALAYIEENRAVLEEIHSTKPKNHTEFQKLLQEFSHSQLYGPDGVLNLLLSFNRVISKLKPETLAPLFSFQQDQSQLLLKIDLRKRAKRSVEVSLYQPEIKEPNLPAVRLDIQGLKVIKLLKPDGTYMVQYWADLTTRRTGSHMSLEYIVRIYPRSKTVEIGRPGFVSKRMTFDEFDRSVKAKPFFFHTLELERGR